MKKREHRVHFPGTDFFPALREKKREKLEMNVEWVACDNMNAGCVCVRVCLCGFLYEMRKNLCTLAVTNDFRSRITFSLLTCSLCVSLFSCTFFCTLIETKVLRRSSFFATTVTVPRLQSKNASVFSL